MFMILVDVDDLLLAADLAYMPKLRAQLQVRFKSGKWVEGTNAISFAGRTL